MANEWTYNINDAAVSPAAFALGAAGATTRSAQIDLQTASTSGLNPRIEAMELEIQAPALAVGELANGQTVTYALEDSSAAGGGYTLRADSIVVQTGAGGAGAAAQTVRAKIPSDALRYVNIRCVSSAGAGNPSTQNCTVKLLF
jgi:hypothetical protein